MKTKEKIARIIYWWRRYEGKRTKKGKDYNFNDLDLLERRIDAYFKNPKKFVFNNPTMGWKKMGTYIYKE